MWTQIRYLWREWRPIAELAVPDYHSGESLLKITMSRFSLQIGFLSEPEVNWNQPGYDNLWTTWAAYPLFDFEAYNKEKWEGYERKPLG